MRTSWARINHNVRGRGDQVLFSDGESDVLFGLGLCLDGFGGHRAARQRATFHASYILQVPISCRHNSRQPNTCALLLRSRPRRELSCTSPTRRWPTCPRGTEVAAHWAESRAAHLRRREVNWFTASEGEAPEPLPACCLQVPVSRNVRQLHIVPAQKNRVAAEARECHPVMRHRFHVTADGQWQQRANGEASLDCTVDGHGSPVQRVPCAGTCPPVVELSRGLPRPGHCPLELTTSVGEMDGWHPRPMHTSTSCPQVAFQVK